MLCFLSRGRKSFHIIVAASPWSILSERSASRPTGRKVGRSWEVLRVADGELVERQARATNCLAVEGIPMEPSQRQIVECINISRRREQKRAQVNVDQKRDIRNTTERFEHYHRGRRCFRGRGPAPAAGGRRRGTLRRTALPDRRTSFELTPKSCASSPFRAAPRGREPGADVEKAVAVIRHRGGRKKRAAVGQLQLVQSPELHVANA